MIAARSQQVHEAHIRRGRTAGSALFRFNFFLAVIVMSAPSAAVAVGENPAYASLSVPLEEATDIQAQPLALLARFPQAGPAMARFVAAIVIRQPQMVGAILSVIGDTSHAQASAIGAGLVRATRVIAAKQPDQARAIAAKIMQSDNIWLKTTFSALGLRYAVNTTLLRPPPLPAVPLARREVGTQLAADRARLGPSPHYDGIMSDNRAAVVVPFELLEQLELINQHDILVASVASEASVNGAVSTSPTH